MYTTNPDQLRQGLVNYVGAMVATSSLDKRAARHAVSAVLVEEAIALSKNSEEELDFFVLKPILRGTVFTLEKRVQEMDNLPDTQEVKNAIKSYKTIISRLEKLVEDLK